MKTICIKYELKYVNSMIEIVNKPTINGIICDQGIQKICKENTQNRFQQIAICAIIEINASHGRRYQSNY